MHKILAAALKRAHNKAENNIIRSALLSQVDRGRLLTAGLIREIIKGWYVLVDPTKDGGESTFWYASYWNFIQVYLKHRLGEKYCLSAECSLDVWAESEQVFPQLVVITQKSTASIVKLPFNSSILIYQEKKNFPKTVIHKSGLRVIPLEVAIVRASLVYSEHSALNMELLLRQASVSAISRELLANEAVTAAGRIAFLYKKYGLEKESQEIIENMRSAGFAIKIVSENFDKNKSFLPSGEKIQSPYSGRIKALWYEFRKEIMANIDIKPSERLKNKELLIKIEDAYVSDAYNSLSIEGYTVTEELIERIRNGNWDPNKLEDVHQRDVLAAKGYRNAFEAVQVSIERTLFGTSSGLVIEEELQKWYRELFSPFVRLGLIPPENLAGYRNHPVFIKNSRHVPPRHESVPELMETYFELLKNEADPIVGAILGHFFFVYIHPYMDGNGRLGRFIMNLFLVSGGYPWTIIEVSRRREYMESLEKASVGHEIVSFAKFVCSEISSK